MEIESILSTILIVALSTASLVTILQLLRQWTTKNKVWGSFSNIILILIIGWSVIELLQVLSLRLIGEVAEMAHLFMMLAFSAGITYHWWSTSKTVTEGQSRS